MSRGTKSQTTSTRIVSNVSTQKQCTPMRNVSALQDGLDKDTIMDCLNVKGTGEILTAHFHKRSLLMENAYALMREGFSESQMGIVLNAKSLVWRLLTAGVFVCHL